MVVTIKAIFIKVDIKIRERDKELIIASISTGCGFEIDNFDEVILKQEDNRYFIPSEVDALLKSVSVSTARGVMFSEFRGTYLFNLILPVIIFQPPPIEQIEKEFAKIEK